MNTTNGSNKGIFYTACTNLKYSFKRFKANDADCFVGEGGVRG